MPSNRPDTSGHRVEFLPLASAACGKREYPVQLGVRCPCPTRNEVVALSQCAGCPYVRALEVDDGGLQVSVRCACACGSSDSDSDE